MSVVTGIEKKESSRIVVAVVVVLSLLLSLLLFVVVLLLLFCLTLFYQFRTLRSIFIFYSQCFKDNFVYCNLLLLSQELPSEERTKPVPQTQL